jgi:hypothetical protein
LPAGTYVFKLADTDANRDIVQVFPEDQKHILATIMAIPDYRQEPRDKTVVTFEERASGSPEAVHSWFYPGDTDGVQFVYPKAQVQEAARSEEAAPRPAAPAPAVTAQQGEDEPPVIMGEEEVIVAQAAPETPSDNAPAADSDSASAGMPDTLPQTAGNLVSIPLLGMALLSGGFTAIRFASKQN